MSFSATQALIVNLFIVSRLGFHVPAAALSTGCRAGCALEVAPLRRPTPFFSVPSGQLLFVCLAAAVAFDCRFERRLADCFPVCAGAPGHVISCSQRKLLPPC